MSYKFLNFNIYLLQDNGGHREREDNKTLNRTPVDFAHSTWVCQEKSLRNESP